MAPLSLKIIVDDGTVTRTVKFDSRTTVEEAHSIVKDKVVGVDAGREHGLFLTSTTDDLSGIWLENHRTLEYYMLRDGDSLYYISRNRNLRVKMLDGTVKTLQVDESKVIGDLMMLICAKIGLTNHDEYGLCHMETEESDDQKASMTSTGTLTLKRKQVHKEKDMKLEQMSKKLKTDDNVEWLDQHKTLREQCVDPKETLLLKRRLFYSDRNVDSRDPVQLNLLYVQTRDAILEGRHPVTEIQGADCKVRWINIRDVNRRILRQTNADPKRRMKAYKYEKELSFMRPFYKDGNFSLSNNLNYESDGSRSQDNQYLDEDIFNDSDNSSKVVSKRRKTRSSKLKAEKKVHVDETEEVEINTLASVSNETSMLTELNPADAVDAFLLSIGATLKTFTPYHLNLAKSKIFGVVQEHDLQQIMEKGRSEVSDVKVSTSDPIYLS